jgi:hypothetical protein
MSIRCINECGYNDVLEKKCQMVFFGWLEAACTGRLDGLCYGTDGLTTCQLVSENGVSW